MVEYEWILIRFLVARLLGDGFFYTKKDAFLGCLIFPFSSS